MAQMNLSTKQRLTDIENRLVLVKAWGRECNGLESMGLVDVNYYM